MRLESNQAVRREGGVEPVLWSLAHKAIRTQFGSQCDLMQPSR